MNQAAQRVLQEVKNTYGGAKGIIISPSYLRLESAALGTQNTIAFNVLSNEGTPNETEKRLNISDNFVAYGWGFYLMKVTTAGTTRSGVLDTFRNVITYSASNESANLRAIYNGNVSLTVNGTQVLPSVDVTRFFRAGYAQKNVGLSTYDATNNANNKFLESEWNTNDYGMQTCERSITFSGAWKHQLQINVPASVAMAGSSSSNYGVWILRGYLIQNGSTFNV